MLKVEVAQVEYMRDAVFFDGPEASRRLSRFWILLTLAAVIACTGVISDSTATVIGAMIVAPLMIPIQGTMLASVIGDRENLIRSVLLVIAAATAVVAIGFVLALLVPGDLVAATNSQIAGRVNPGLPELVGALATGAVGSIALIRRDISDTLPGVAIAISLVPPLCVVGMTLEARAFTESWGALLLFITNVAAILAVGSIVMAIYQVGHVARPTSEPGKSTRHRRSPIVIALMFVLVAIPLTTSSLLLIERNSREREVSRVTRTWADQYGWEVVGITTRDGNTVVRLTGPLPIPETDSLRDAISAAGVDATTVQADFIPSEKVDFGAVPELDPAP